MYTFYASDKSHNNHMRLPGLTLPEAIRMMRISWSRWENVEVQREWNNSTAFAKFQNHLYQDRTIRINLPR